MKTLGAAILLVGCASGSAPFSQPPVGDDQPDAMKQPDAPPIEPPADAPTPPVDQMIQPPDATVTPDACVPQQQEKLANPALDLTPMGMGWVDGRDARTNALAGGPFPMISANPSGLAAHSAPNKAWFGGAAGSDVSPPASSLTDQLHQDITFPADATNFIVSGMFLVGSNDDPSAVFDTFRIDVVETNGTLIESVFAADNTTVADTFTPFSKTLSSNLAGRTVRLRMVSVNDDVFLTNFFVDSLSFKATACP